MSKQKGTPPTVPITTLEIQTLHREIQRYYQIVKVMVSVRVQPNGKDALCVELMAAGRANLLLDAEMHHRVICERTKWKSVDAGLYTLYWQSIENILARVGLEDDLPFATEL